MEGERGVGGREEGEGGAPVNVPHSYAVGVNIKSRTRATLNERC